ncbi:MAG: hypothetical protein AAF661_02115 [Pseudomonadota bacterium]
MKAFLVACVAIVAITIGADMYLNNVMDASSESRYSTDNVRLD